MRMSGAVLGLLLLVAGCGDDTSPSTVSATFPSDPTITLPSPTSVATPTTEGSLIFPPLAMSGSGDRVIQVAVPGGVPALVTIIHSGTGGFAVWSHAAGGEMIDLLVDHVGAYRGIRPINLRQNEAVATLEIEADGAWTISVESLLNATHIAGASFSGVGDDLLIDPEPPSQPVSAAITYDGEGHFAVWAYGDTRDLIVNRIGSYSGEVLVPAGTILWEIVADGRWSVDRSG